MFRFWDASKIFTGCHVVKFKFMIGYKYKLIHTVQYEIIFDLTCIANAQIKIILKKITDIYNIKYFLIILSKRNYNIYKITVKFTI